MKLSLQSAVNTLHGILNQDGAQGQTADSVRQQAQDLNFPYPELAAQVFTFLQSRAPQGHARGLEDISEAFMKLLLSGDSLEALGGKDSQNAWLNVRSVLRNTGMGVGSSLLEVYETVRRTGLGYTPTLLDLSAELAAVVARLPQPADLAALRSLSASLAIDPWKAKLLALWYQRRKGSGMPTDEELEELLADPENIQELGRGPWQIYQQQANALRTLRNFGKSLVDLADAAEH